MRGRCALIGVLLLVPALRAAPLVARSGTVRMWSSTKMENIEGTSKTAVSTLDLDSGTIAIKVRNTTFQFPNKLMQEHFNENYMESDKFPVSSFAGRLSGLDRGALASGKTVSVTVEGELDVHGVKRRYSVPATLRRLPDGTVEGETKFHVGIADHGIKVPTLVVAKIAESMEITARFDWRGEGAAK